MKILIANGDGGDGLYRTFNMTGPLVANVPERGSSHKFEFFQLLLFVNYFAIPCPRER